MQISSTSAVLVSSLLFSLRERLEFLVTHRMGDTPKVIALAPPCAHGETEDNPKPLATADELGAVHILPGA